MVEDEIDKKIMELLETYAKHEPNPDYLPMTVNAVKDHMNNLLNIRILIEDKSYQIPPRKPFMYLRRFMRSQKVDYVDDLFQ